MIRIIWCLAVIHVCCNCSRAQDGSNSYVEDLIFLQSEFEAYHPGFTWYTSPTQMAALYEAARIGVLKEPIDSLAFYRIVRGLVSQVKCGHTYCSMPDEMREGIFAQWRFLPVSVAFVGDTVVVDRVLEGSPLRRGDRILSINGRSIGDIVDTILQFQSGDGFVATGRRRAAEQYFRLYYQLFVNPHASQYDLKIDRGSQKVDVSVEGHSWDQLSSLSPTRPWTTPLELTHLEEYSLLRIHTFSQGAIQAEDQDYSRFLEKAFGAIQKRGVKNLVLDLRGNGGGRDDYGAELVSYLLDRPFDYFQEIEVTASYDGYGGVRDSGGKKVVTSHRGLSTWKPSKNHYDGPLYVMIDGGSFSTCADVASVLKSYGRKLLVGEETGGGARGNTSGNRRNITLPFSAITVHIPLWKYTTARADEHPSGRGVLPDVEVHSSVQHFLENRDAAMERVISDIKAKK